MIVIIYTFDFDKEGQPVIWGRVLNEPISTCRELWRYASLRACIGDMRVFLMKRHDEYVLEVGRGEE